MGSDGQQNPTTSNKFPYASVLPVLLRLFLALAFGPHHNFIPLSCPLSSFSRGMEGLGHLFPSLLSFENLSCASYYTD